MEKFWVLGAPDPEMEAIDRLLSESGEAVAHALGADGRRVRPETAYRAARVSVEIPAGALVYRVECDGPAVPRDAVAIDHHRPGDPGYGRSPADYWAASSIGQVWAILRPGSEPPNELRLAAAADHCLAAAYRGECPGVDPDQLMRWRAKSRAAFQRRPVEAVLADIERAREALLDAKMISLGFVDPYGYCRGCGRKVHATSGDESRDHCTCPQAADMRGLYIPELPEASAREGICFVADVFPGPDGRVKVVCQSGSPEHIRAFMEIWGPFNGLTDIYGDPARGFAGGYYTEAKPEG